MSGKGIKQVFATKLTDVDSSDREGVGTLRFEGNKVYKYCKIMNTSSTVAGVAGDAVGYFALTGYADSRVVLDLSDAEATMAFPAGILVGTVTGTQAVAEYGWVQIKGPATLSTSVNSAAAAQSFKLGATDKTFTICTAATDSVAGVCMNTSTGVALDCVF
jgi:hypothetical protein